MKDKQKHSEQILRITQDKMINEMTSYVEMIGGQTTLGRILGLLLVTYEPISLKQISERLNLSKPSISNSIRIGVTSGMFTKVYHPDFPREDFYEMNQDFVKAMIDPALTKLEMFIDKLDTAAEEIKIHTADNEDVELKKMQNRLEYMSKTFKIMWDEYKEFCNRLDKKLEKLNNELEK